MKVLTKAFTIIAILIFGLAYGSLGEIKQWKFPIHDKVIVAQLACVDVPCKENTVLSLDLEPPGNSVVTAAEEADILSQALRKFMTLGYKPANLVMISLSLRNSEYLAGIENSVAKSGVWRSCVDTKHCWPAASVINQYLKSVNAYKAFDEVLRLYGLERKSVTVDEPSVWRRSGKILCRGTIDIALVDPTSKQTRELGSE